MSFVVGHNAGRRTPSLVVHATLGAEGDERWRFEMTEATMNERRDRHGPPPGLTEEERREWWERQYRKFVWGPGDVVWPVKSAANRASTSGKA